MGLLRVHYESNMCVRYQIVFFEADGLCSRGSAYGPPMDPLWTSYGLSMGLLSLPFGPTIDPLWTPMDPYGPLTALLWTSYGPPMDPLSRRQFESLSCANNPKNPNSPTNTKNPKNRNNSNNPNNQLKV